MAAVNRVHWIRARAQKNRWDEELTLTAYEMQWTVRYFQHRAGKWQEWGTQAEDANKPGPAAYAARKIAMWTNMAQHADIQFKRTSSLYHSPAVSAE